MQLGCATQIHYDDTFVEDKYSSNWYKMWINVLKRAMILKATHEYAKKSKLRAQSTGLECCSSIVRIFNGRFTSKTKRVTLNNIETLEIEMK